jgi:hypothetical protein
MAEKLFGEFIGTSFTHPTGSDRPNDLDFFTTLAKYPSRWLNLRVIEIEVDGREAARKGHQISGSDGTRSRRGHVAQR